MPHLLLEDGRELAVSPGHPIGAGRQAGQMKVGELLGGSLVASVELAAYNGKATYDLLPAGETGYYWANGILLASTLKPNAERAGCLCGTLEGQGR